MLNENRGNLVFISKNEIKYRIDNLFKCTVVVDNSKNYFSFIDNKTEKVEIIKLLRILFRKPIDKIN